MAQDANRYRVRLFCSLSHATVLRGEGMLADCRTASRTAAAPDRPQASTSGPTADTPVNSITPTAPSCSRAQKLSLSAALAGVWREKKTNR